MIAVFDTNVVASAIFWHTSTARRCLTGLARRKFARVVTDEIEREYMVTCATLKARKPQQDPSGPLAWILSRSWRVAPAPLGKRRSRILKTILSSQALWLEGPSNWLQTIEISWFWAAHSASPLLGQSNSCVSSGSNSA